jgi:hypothetical protein
MVAVIAYLAGYVYLTPQAATAVKVYLNLNTLGAVWQFLPFQQQNVLNGECAATDVPIVHYGR